MDNDRNLLRKIPSPRIAVAIRTHRKFGYDWRALERFDFEKVQALSLPARATRRDARRGFLEKPRFFQKCF
jgi:hypothetical protein